MQYYQNLNDKLQDFEARLNNAALSQFDNQLQFFLSFLKKEGSIISFLNELYVRYRSYAESGFEDIINERPLTFENQNMQAIICYHYLIYRTENKNYRTILNFHRGRESGDAVKTLFIQEFISPIIYSIIDNLEKASSTVFLLEKYKRRTEWFTRESLLLKYKSVESNYEKVLEDDLRLFLFDQGIDYPFSTPSSPSGRADVIGSIDTKDPIIIEVKIIDNDKKYGKNRIKEGFTQIQKYANDYNKDVGYLVIYNFDAAEVNFNFTESSNTFPPMLVFQNRKFFFILINLFKGESASKSGKTKSIDITENDLIG